MSYPSSQKLLACIGNKKIGKDTLIMNITSATDCPSLALGLCQVPSGACYALQDERLYRKHTPSGELTGPLTYRRHQTEVWDALSAEEIAEQVKDIVRRRRGTPIKYLRMQESGDFRNITDVDKMSRLADLLKGVVRVYTYTARRDLFPHPHSDNLVINGSGFMVDNNFSVVSSEDQLQPGPVCRGVKGGGCTGCKLCKSKGNRVIQEVLRTKRSLISDRGDMPISWFDLEPSESLVGVQRDIKAESPRKSAKARSRRREAELMLGGIR